VFQQGFRELAYEAMPSLLRPNVGRYGLCDYEKIFCANKKRGEDIFEMRGIDRKAGCIVIVRPDQYVAHILSLDAREDLARYFAGVLKPRRAAAPATPPASRPAPA
jgi:phenol 2-monooxygenase